MSVAPDTTVAFKDRFSRELPEMAVRWQAETSPEPRLLVLNEPLAAELGLDAGWLRGPDGLRLLVGNLVPSGATPVAQAYAGHQFGGFVPRLGDGRALLLGELVDADGRAARPAPQGFRRARRSPAAATAWPRSARCCASTSSARRCTPWASRPPASLAVVATGRPVHRETLLPGAVLARVASSHLRVGSFQYAAATGDVDLLRRLADHAIARHHPERRRRRAARTSRCSKRWSPPRRRWSPSGCWSDSSTA